MSIFQKKIFLCGNPIGKYYNLFHIIGIKTTNMSKVTFCRCCLVRPPDKDLKTMHIFLGKPEIYSDMLKECFEIHLPAGTREGDNGICEMCITRLRDASDFKKQVQQCQKEFQMQVDLSQKATNCQDDEVQKVKEEITDPEDDNGIYFLEIKDELSDCENLMDDDDKKLAEMLSLADVTIKRKSKRIKKLGLDKTDSDRKSKKLLTKPLKISLHALSQMEKLKNSSVASSLRYVSEKKKHKANITNIIKYSNCTPFSSKTLTGIVCAYCKDTHPNTETLRTHTQEVHKEDDLNANKRIDKNNMSLKVDITDLKCSICNAKTPLISDLKMHLMKEHDIKFYLDINDYILEFKLTDGEMLNCALCHSTYETFKMLLQHMNGHYRNYICEVCDLGFINKHRLKNHQRTHELGTFKCSFCDKVFSTRVKMMCHEKYTHNTSARYTTNCPYCDQSFTSYYQRNRHMSNEHNTAAASYKCNICDKSFILKSKLTSHIKKVHLMERNHKCAECGQGFFIKQSLDEHMIKHTGERVYKCTVCHKAYARKKTLREHMRIHNNDRRFKCGVCGLAFIQKCSLKSHMLSNHGITLSEYENVRTELNST
ncbi:zinc finger imprinted 3-like isoform X2 [Galleria mellonella]|uniref:Zinc finger imprinted 3-like isoform X2 n=1 Tax=Galleria mellonella TaxID=7137 RepID=A0A6J3C3V1_GALME|nr:zinc finger imprinted 3-like isoform X2 [Galleria mellonella]